jgi:hypothetical protein
MVRRYPTTRFSSWVREVTIGGVLERLRDEEVVLTHQAVYRWLEGRSSPPLTTAAVIVQVSAGAVSFEDLVHHRREASSDDSSGAGGVAGGTPVGNRRD